jgi:hypothetical protein
LRNALRFIEPLLFNRVYGTQIRSNQVYPTAQRAGDAPMLP